MKLRQALRGSPVKQAIGDEVKGRVRVIVTRLEGGGCDMSVIALSMVFYHASLRDEKAVEQVLWDRLCLRGMAFEPVYTRYTASPFRTSMPTRLQFLSWWQRCQSGLRAASWSLWRRRVPVFQPEQVLQFLYALVGRLLGEQRLVLRVQDLHVDRLREPHLRLSRWLVSLFVSLAFGFPLGLICGLLSGQVVMLLAGPLLGLLLGWLYGRGKQIRRAEESWSWPYALGGFFLPWGTFLAWLVLMGLVSIWLPLSLFFGLVGGLFIERSDSGWEDQLLDDSSPIKPLSLREWIWCVPNGLLVWLLCGGSGALLWLVWGGRTSEISHALLVGLVIGLPIGLGAGLASFAQQMVALFLKWRTNHLPARLAPFLDQAVSRGWLRQIKDHYRVTPRLLLSYFDSLEQPLPPGIDALQDGFTVSSFPSSPAGGQFALIIYDGWLAPKATRLMMHWGYNGWEGITDTAMTKQRDGIWEAIIMVSENATVLNMAFYDQSETWDNRQHNDYHLLVREGLLQDDPKGGT